MQRFMLAIACCMALCAVHAYTQDTAVVTKPVVVVTATRMAEDVERTPLAITVVPPMVLETQRGYGVDGLLTLVPGVIGQSRTGGIDARVQIRGFGARGAGQRSNAGTSRGIKFLTDGIPETEPDGRTSFDLINTVHASNVEVIRSNASALWGNAAGGVVSVSTVPKEQHAFITADLTAGSFGFARQSLLANTPLGEGQAYVSLTNTVMDGWREMSRGFQTLGTVGLLMKPTNQTNLNMFITGATNQFEIPGPLTREQYEADPQQAQDDIAIYKPTFVQRNERRDNRLVRIGTTFSHMFDTENGVYGSAFVQSKKLQRSERNTWRDFNRYHIGGSAGYKNVHVFGGETANTILVGADVQYQDGAILFYSLDSATASRGTSLRQNKREGAINMGGYVQNEFRTRLFTAEVGLRLDAVRYLNEDYINPIADTTATYSRLIPKLGFAYHASPLFNPYVNVGGGLEAPAGNETDPPNVIGSTTPTAAINPLLKPIVSTTFELGVKGGELLEGDFLEQFSYDVAAWYIMVENDIVPYNSGAFYVPAAQSRRMGLEFGLTAITKVGLTIAGAFTFMHAEYRNYVIDSGYINVQLDGRTADYTGNTQPGIPGINSTVRLRYDASILGGLYGELEWRTMGSYTVDDANTILTDAWSTVACAAGVKVPIIEKHLQVDARMRLDNVLDTKYMASAWVNPDITRGGTPFVEAGLPRNFMATIGMTYTP